MFHLWLLIHLVTLLKYLLTIYHMLLTILDFGNLQSIEFSNYVIFWTKKKVLFSSWILVLECRMTEHIMRLNRIVFCKAAVPNLFGARHWFPGRKFFHGQGWGKWFGHGSHKQPRSLTCIVRSRVWASMKI